MGDDHFQRLVTALEPWLDRVVIVGGWAHRLYHLHPHAQELDYSPLTTLDTDVAVPPELLAGEQQIRERLLAHGFMEEFQGDDRPPATHYHLGDVACGFYAEFLTPLIGGEYDRKHRRKATRESGGISSQQLRHVELLLDHPWSIGYEIGGVVVQVQVANPVCFMAQKVLVYRRRDQTDRAKDILYLHDTLEVFGAWLPELRELWRSVVAPRMKGETTKAVRRASKTLFGKVSDDTRRAARITAERALSPESITRACHDGLMQVFE